MTEVPVAINDAVTPVAHTRVIILGVFHTFVWEESAEIV